MNSKQGRCLVVAVALVLLASTAPVLAQKPARSKAGSGDEAARRVDALNDAVMAEVWYITDMHWHKGEYNHIINLDRMIIAARPDHLDAYANAGWLLWSMNRDAEAVALYEQGLKANPDNFYMYDELGGYYFLRKKDYARAISYYEKAAKFNDCPTRPTLHALAHAYELNKQLDKAVATWNLIIEREPKNDAAKNNLERVKRLLQQGGGANG